MGGEAGVVEKVSNAPTAPSSTMLSGEKMQEFASALGSQAPEPAPAAEPAAPPSESARTEEAPEQPAAQPPPAPAAPPPPPPAQPGPIPYERFVEVNEQKNRALAEKAEFERRLAQDVRKMADEGTAKKLIEIAEAYPELAPVIFGTATAPKAPEAPRPAGAPPEAPKDPRILREMELEKRIKSLEGVNERQRQAEVIRNVEQRADAQMEKHPIFRNAKIRERAEEIIVNHILTRPHLPPEKIVDDVAQGFREIEASIKAEYEQKKKDVARNVVPGVGPGAPPAPPGQGQKKLKLGDGSALKALAAAMGAANRQAS